MRWITHTLLALFVLGPGMVRGALPFNVVFQGKPRFDALVAKAKSGNWKALPIGERTATVGRALVGTPYKNYTLEIDDRIEAPSANFNAMDCWTFFEIALGFARMLDEPEENWSPRTLLKYIELDRYRGGHCDGSYISRLHYLEEWILDNSRRGLVKDLTPALGGVRVSNVAREMTVNWKSYRYMRNSAAVREGIRKMEERVSRMPFTHIPKSRVAGIESKLRDGDVICITTRDRGGFGTSHVGLACRDSKGVLHFMHASHPRNHGKVIIDSRLSTYLNKFSSIAGIMVARPVR